MMMTGVGTPVDVILANFWTLDGTALHGFSEGDFVRRDPDNGDRLFANLELWKISAQMDLVKGDLENMIFGGGACEASCERSSELLLPGIRLSEDTSSGGSSDASDTCSSVDARSPRPSFLTHPELMQTDDGKSPSTFANNSNSFRLADSS